MGFRVPEGRRLPAGSQGRGGFRGYALGVPPDDFNGVTLDRVTRAEPCFPQGAVGQLPELPDLGDGVQGRDVAVGIRPQCFRRRYAYPGELGEPPRPPVPVDGVCAPAALLCRGKKCD